VVLLVVGAGVVLLVVGAGVVLLVVGAGVVLVPSPSPPPRERGRMNPAAHCAATVHVMAKPDVWRHAKLP
jgi:hypothetical protein